MGRFSRPEPQQERNTEPLRYTEVDPDYQPEEGEPTSSDPFAGWERDEDGWPIAPGLPGSKPAIWKD